MPTLIRIASFAAAALLLAGGAFIAGRATAPSAGDASACAEARQLLRQANDEVLAAEGNARIGHARVAANAILQNPHCFNAEARATAQSALDEINAPRDEGSEPIDTFLLKD